MLTHASSSFSDATKIPLCPFPRLLKSHRPGSIGSELYQDAHTGVQRLVSPRSSERHCIGQVCVPFCSRWNYNHLHPLYMHCTALTQNCWRIYLRGGAGNRKNKAMNRALHFWMSPPNFNPLSRRQGYCSCLAVVNSTNHPFLIFWCSVFLKAHQYVLSWFQKPNTLAIQEKIGHRNEAVFLNAIFKHTIEDNATPLMSPDFNVFQQFLYVMSTFTFDLNDKRLLRNMKNEPHFYSVPKKTGESFFPVPPPPTHVQTRSQAVLQSGFASAVRRKGCHWKSWIL